MASLHHVMPNVTYCFFLIQKLFHGRDDHFGLLLQLQVLFRQLCDHSIHFRTSLVLLKREKRSWALYDTTLGQQQAHMGKLYSGFIQRSNAQKFPVCLFGKFMVIQFSMHAQTINVNAMRHYNVRRLLKSTASRQPVSRASRCLGGGKQQRLARKITPAPGIMHVKDG